MLYRIHVNRHVIAANRRSGTRDPVYRLRSYRGVTTAHAFEIVHDDVVVLRGVYRPDRPLSCGAVAWLETSAEIRVLGAPSRPKQGEGSHVCAPKAHRKAGRARRVRRPPVDRN